MTYNLNSKYGVTEVFVKHDYYSNLRVKLVRKDSKGNTILLNYKGDSLTDVSIIHTDKKLYPIPKGFLSIDVDENHFYFYESGDYSIYRYKYIKHSGSSRSGKSWALEEASLQICERNPNTRFTIWRDTKASLGETIWKDYHKIFPLSGRDYKFPQNTMPIYFGNKSVIEPHGDDTTNAHGLTQDYAWLNEPYKMKEETFNQIDMRAGQVWLDMNPIGKHWSDKLDNNPRCIKIHSTFDRNPFCPIEMKLKILSHDPNNPINVANGTANHYLWLTYGLGLKAERPNRIFSNWGTIAPEDWDYLHYPSYYGLDFGLSAPTALIEMKFDGDRTFYVRELLYKPLNDMPWTLAEELENLGIDKRKEIICDSGNELNQAEAQKLLNAGFNVIKAKKGQGSRISGIELLQKYAVKYTRDSTNFEDEYENYCWRVAKGVQLDEPEAGNDHLLDAFKYPAVWFARVNYLS